MSNYLVVILYSREQMQKEGDTIDADWGVVGCMYTEYPQEIPMAPITMMRNALGVDEGGSGVAMDREAYRRSVAFWESNANWWQKLSANELHVGRIVIRLPRKAKYAELFRPTCWSGYASPLYRSGSGLFLMSFMASSSLIVASPSRVSPLYLTSYKP